MICFSLGPFLLALFRNDLMNFMNFCPQSPLSLSLKNWKSPIKQLETTEKSRNTHFYIHSIWLFAPYIDFAYAGFNTLLFIFYRTIFKNLKVNTAMLWLKNSKPIGKYINIFIIKSEELWSEILIWRPFWIFAAILLQFQNKNDLIFFAGGLMGKCTKSCKDPIKEFENIKGFQKFAVTFIIFLFYPQN